MTNKQLNEHLNKLDQIQSVDPSPYLFTRIQQKIQGGIDNRISVKSAWSLAFSLLCILVLNIYVITSIESTPVNKNNTEDTFNLIPHNNLY